MRTTLVRPWFALVRHDDDDPAKPSLPTVIASPEQQAPSSPPKPKPPLTSPTPSDTEEPDFPAETPLAEMTPEQQISYWRDKARKHENRPGQDLRRELADLRKKASRLDEIEESQKTEAEKLQTAKDAAEARAAAAISRAVSAEIKVLASAEFADPTDAEAAIKAADFVDDKGEIDVDGIKARLNELLEAKPHWRKAPAEPAKPKVPKPDPGQGARGKPAELDYRSASKEDFTAALAEYRLSPRT